MPQGESPSRTRQYLRRHFPREILITAIFAATGGAGLWEDLNWDIENEAHWVLDLTNRR
jgi:hypothetical protein